MQTNHLIAITDFCVNHNIEVAFISSLQQTGLVEITVVNEIEFIEASQLQQLEKFVRLYYDLDINMEGIDTITHLLQRINIMHNEIATLRNRLKFYESID